MAKRKRAAARRGLTSRKIPHRTPQTDAPEIHLPRSRRPTYTPELLAQARHDFEHTERSKESIAFDLGVARSTLSNMAVREKWKRHVPPPRGLPPAVHLRREAEMLEASVAVPPPENISPATTNGQGAMPAIADTVERLYRAVRDELTAVESLRARLKNEPQGTQDAERTARTLSSLTETLQKCSASNAPLPIQDPRMTTCLPISMNSVQSLRDALKHSSKAGLVAEMLRDPQILRCMQRFHGDFIALAHPHQEPPSRANNGDHWTTWLMLGGRGAGKTRLGAEWVRAMAHGICPYADRRSLQIALVGETEHDVREVMIEGPAGLLQISPRRERPEWTASRRRLEWPNGAVGFAFSAEDPEQLRGPQFDAAWCDELAKWRHVDATFDMLQFGLRLGQRPRQLITTTPRPIPLIKRLIVDPRTAVTRASTHANAAHLSPAFLDEVLARYSGTRLGRQEIDGEIIEERVDALWTRTLIEASRIAAAPPLMRVAVGIDPPGSARPGADACGIVAAGMAEDGRIYVLEDATVAGLSPFGWATKAVALFRRLDADAMVAEVNMGGDMVRGVLAQVDPAIPLRTVHATRGKWVRAEPVALMYQQGKIRHVDPPMKALEDEMCDFGMGGLSSGASPDRLDAMVWAVTELITRGVRGPRIRML